MKNMRVAAAFAAAALMVFVQGCSVFNWGSAPKEAEVAPVPKTDDVFREGEALLESGKYDEARKAYSKVRETDPEKTYEPLVMVRLGDSYYEESRYAEAEVEYRRFLDLHPRNKAAAYTKYQLGMCGFKQMGTPDRDPGFALAAMKEFQELLDLYPGSPYEEEAREKLRVARGKVGDNEFIVGMYYYKRGSYPAAIKRFKGMVEKFPGSKNEPEALYCMADSYISLGEYGYAKDTLTMLFTEHPNHEMAAKAKDKLSPEIPEEK